MSTSSNLKYSIPSRPAPTKFPLQSPRGAKLATRVWPVKNDPPKALCLIVHGGGWHSGYFEDFAAALTREGIFCASYDQVNSGYSDPEPDTPKPGVVHVRNFDCFVQDVFAAVEWMKKEAGTSSKKVPLFLFGESFGALEVISAGFQQEKYNVKIDGVVSSGGLLQLGDQFLPPAVIVKVVCFLAGFFPRTIMPATDFESTFDAAFGDKEWAKTSRADPKVTMELVATIGAIAATLGTGTKLRAKAQDFPTKFYAVHGKGDVRTSCAAMQEFVQNIGPEKASMDTIETEGHQLLQDDPEVVKDVVNKVKNWILNVVEEQD